MPVPSYPPFPDNVPTHPLFIIDHELIKAGDPKEIERLWEAATSLGFWYLKNHGTENEVDAMFDLGAKVMSLPLDEKMKFSQGDGGKSFGYKSLGSNLIEASGLRDAYEDFNIAKDDAVSYPSVTHRTYPTPINDAMQSVVAPFVRKSVEVTKMLIDVFNDKLGLPADELGRRHSITEVSGNQARFIRVPSNLPLGKTARGHHTDFGSLSFLHNRLGGLQVLLPGTETWQYIKPIPGHAICNIGDALHILSGGVLHSNIHRVLPPPGDQANFERHSVVFFLRPGNSVLLNALTEESSLIKASVDRAEPGRFTTGTTAGEWHSRRVKYRRAINQKDPQSWVAGQGTEGKIY
ncbi:hypothetical protein M422DRAFT_170941 [Sphaerobolus stellatus SS14]|uniref:Unplaced genomic scaffold SPHSTscaffold_54, whole genome shotgun sequence n=1 Tax=Sphaerobolus stellatus (strain SS14) TaxID=990650 RepID=A0A0C9V6F1_SPHS4|nr:hypothetical protein M422DRAFT_170941 [Sphaerobolus stellatus SS14]